MNKYVSVIGIVVVILAALGFLSYTFLEVYDKEVYESPSPEVRANDYLALQRWLSKSGHPVKTLPYTNAEDILHVEESAVIMNASSFSWEENTFDALRSWLEEGNHLFIFYDYWQSTFYDEHFYSFVEQFDVKIITPNDEIENQLDHNDDINSQESEPNISTSDESEIIAEDEEDYLYLDQTIRFKIDEKRTDILFAGADTDAINLVQVSLGNGSVIFTGSPFFMQNNNLRHIKNRMLAWNLTGAKDTDKQGILFIQEVEFQNTFLQDIINEGNIFPLVISIFLFIMICFWGFIPRFGKIVIDDESSAKPIRERFLAEAIFLKKFHSLNMYINMYEKNIQQRLRKNYGEHIDDKKIFCTRLAEIVKLDENIIEQSLYPKKIITSRSFVKCMKTIEIILERL